MPTTPFFSVIIPTWNLESYIHRTLGSVLAQVDADYELIVVDDGSTDNTVECIQAMANLFRRFKLIESSAHTTRGCGRARNIGLNAAQGDYVLFIDGDDVVHPTQMRDLKNKLLEMNQPDVLAFDGERHETQQSSSVDTPDEVNVMRNQFLENTMAETVISGHDATLHFLNYKIRYCTPSKAYKRSFLNAHSIRYDETLSNFEDQLFNIQAFSKAQNVGIVPRHYYFYIKRNASNSSKTGLENLKALKFTLDAVHKSVAPLTSRSTNPDTWQSALFNYSWLLVVSEKTLLSLNEQESSIQRHGIDLVMTLLENPSCSTLQKGINMGILGMLAELFIKTLSSNVQLQPNEVELISSFLRRAKQHNQAINNQSG